MEEQRRRRKKRRRRHILLLIVKTLLSKKPTYISSLLSCHISQYDTRSTAGLLLNVPWLHLENCTAASSFYAPYVRNEFQNIISLGTIPSLRISSCVLRTALSLEPKYVGFSCGFFTLCIYLFIVLTF